MKTTVELAREAGVEFTFDPTESGGRVFAECWLDELERFADLVRADAIAKEREACAKVCEKHKIDGQLIHSNAVVGCAAAIRARGNT